METMMTMAEWLAAQARAARESAKTHPVHSSDEQWDLAQAVAYEAAHAYAVVRREPTPEPQGEPTGYSWEFSAGDGIWKRTFDTTRPAPQPWRRNIMALYGRPLPQAEDPAGQVEPVAWAALSKIRARTYSADRGCALHAEAVAEISDIAGAALAVPAPSWPAASPDIVPASHLREVTDKDVEWLAREAIRQNHRTLARIAVALLVGRT